MTRDKYTAIYVRVSTAGQDHASQLPDLERWVGAHDGTVRWFKDKWTGKTLDRPAMTAVLDAMHRGDIERIVVWRLDRLGRTARGLCALFDDLRERRVDLVSLRDGFSLNSPAGRLHARILASVAEYETEVRAERVRAGQAAAKANGKKWGGRKKGTFVKLSPERVEAIRRMRAEGTGISRIARVLGISRPTVYRGLDLKQPESA